jgi:hypothetical protein
MMAPQTTFRGKSEGPALVAVQKETIRGAPRKHYSAEDRGLIRLLLFNPPDSPAFFLQQSRIYFFFITVSKLPGEMQCVVKLDITVSIILDLLEVSLKIIMMVEPENALIVKRRSYVLNNFWYVISVSLYPPDVIPSSLTLIV